ncbi:MAG: phosphotransferase [Clostridiales bacterium]|nr:phosphotransferase [Clostridiales bacterium]
MLRLKYLFEDLDLATQLVQQYEYDDISILKYFRISSNAIYPFRFKEEVRFLRATPVEETEALFLKGEIALLNALEQKDFPCVRILESLNHNLLEEQQTREGVYYTSVFERVPGECVDEIEMTSEIAFKMGRSLASLHLVSEEVDVELPSYLDSLDWMEKELQEMALEKDLEDLAFIRSGLMSLPKKNFGIVHYDYEPDNLFLEGDTIYPLDFNDAMYHFYTMDILNTINELPENFSNDFLEGYKKLKPLSDNYMEEKKWCDLFSKLYKNTRVKRSIFEPIMNEPEWMVALRSKLESSIAVIQIPK